MSEWRTIESFEQLSDKTERVLIYVPGRGILLAQHVFGGFGQWVVGSEVFAGTDGPKLNRAPTHWMPLPPPPSTTQPE